MRHAAPGINHRLSDRDNLHGGAAGNPVALSPIEDVTGFEWPPPDEPAFDQRVFSDEPPIRSGYASAESPPKAGGVTPELPAPGPPRDIESSHSRGVWISEAVWAAALRSPDVIVAILALILTIGCGVAFRLGAAESVAAMWLGVLRLSAGPDIALPAPPPLVAAAAEPPRPSPFSLFTEVDAAPVAERTRRVLPAGGRLVVRSDPPGAEISINGRVHGLTPRTIGQVAPGEYQVVLKRGDAEVRETVTVAAGATVSVVAPFHRGRGGWLSIASALELDVIDRGVFIGSSRAPRIMLEAGSHALELVNEATGFRTIREVGIQPGAVETITVDAPMGTLDANAVPWAEVWIDGESIGQTPIGNHRVASGNHRIVFRHPLLGEKEIATVVKANTPTRLTVNLLQAGR